MVYFRLKVMVQLIFCTVSAGYNTTTESKQLQKESYFNLIEYNT